MLDKAIFAGQVGDIEAFFDTDTIEFEILTPIVGLQLDRSEIVLEALSTGMRAGELLGVQWVDVDEELGILQVRRQLVRRPTTDDKKSTELADPKTSVGRRRIDLPSNVMKTLMAHKALMDAEGYADLRAHVFCTPAGRPLHYNNLINRSFLPLLEKAKLPRIRFHALRHTHASQLLRTGAHPKVVSERLGHSRVGFTLDVYSHLLPSMQRDAADRIDAMFDTDKLQSDCTAEEQKDAPSKRKPSLDKGL